jgi:hypothetical protein
VGDRTVSAETPRQPSESEKPAPGAASRMGLEPTTFCMAIV